MIIISFALFCKSLTVCIIFANFTHILTLTTNPINIMFESLLLALLLTTSYTAYRVVKEIKSLIVESNADSYICK